MDININFNNNLKKIKFNLILIGILALAAIFMLSMSVMAQDPSTSTQDHKGEKKEFRQGERRQVTPQIRAERLAKQLSLT